MPGIERSDSPATNGPAPGEGPVVHAFDCTDPIHEEARFTAETEDVLVEKVLGHFAEYHPEVTRDAVLSMISATSYVEAPQVDSPS